MTDIRIAVFASGQGSNFRRLLAAEQAGELGVGRISLLVSDQPEAPAIGVAQAASVPVFAEHPRVYGDKRAWETRVLQELHGAGIELVVLAGFMRLIGPVLLTAYEGRMINLHPSFLPEFKGKDAIGQALAAGVSETGVSVHYVSEALDGGQVIEQVRIAIDRKEDRASLEARIHAMEHELLPIVVRKLCQTLAEEK